MHHLTTISVGLTLAQVLGPAVIVSVLEPYFRKPRFPALCVNGTLCLAVVAVVVVGLCYSYVIAFYRTSAREVKRLRNYPPHIPHVAFLLLRNTFPESMLRSLLYAHFSETLTGLSTIRSYGEMKRFIKANRYYTDLENRSLFLVVTNKRWLTIRLDLMGDTLTFIVSGYLLGFLFFVVYVYRLHCLQSQTCLGSMQRKSAWS